VIITLLTDFGVRDWFVPSMKGVMLGIAPHAQIVDLTHEIPSQDVRAGAFLLAAAAPAFPKGTIHVAVIDPGVGSRRKAVAVKTRNHVFIGPDNGLLSLALQREKGLGIRTLQNERLFRNPVSHTFHGRDVFAPVAAHLASGGKFSDLGPRQKTIRPLAMPAPTRTGKVIRGEIIYIDHFGNLITNISSDELEENSAIRVGRHSIHGISPSYSEVKRGALVAVVNSLGLLEIGLRDGNAARSSHLKLGTLVRAFLR
jgi:S-adenosylmethionine hydrolase